MKRPESDYSYRFYNGEPVSVGQSCDILPIVERFNACGKMVLYFNGNESRLREQVGQKLKKGIEGASYLHFQQFSTNHSEAFGNFDPIPEEPSTMIIENLHSADDHHTNLGLTKINNKVGYPIIICVPVWPQFCQSESLQNWIMENKPRVLEITSKPLS